MVDTKITGSYESWCKEDLIDLLGVKNNSLRYMKRALTEKRFEYNLLAREFSVLEKEVKRLRDELAFKRGAGHGLTY